MTALRPLRVVAGLLLALALVGCGSDRTAGPQPSPTVTTPAPSASPTPAATQAVSVYFLHGETLQPARRTVTGPGVAAGAVRALLEGPTAGERAAGLTSAVPDGTRLVGLSLREGLATVDLTGRYEAGGGSLSMASRLAQVVFTATQFPTVRQVEFRLDGKAVAVFGGEGLVLDHPVARADYEHLTPAILVESPVIGDTVRSPLRVTGSADVFEAVLQLQVRGAQGQVLVTQTVHATSGTGTRGTFDATLRFTAPAAGTGSLVGFVYSAKDGSRQVVTTVPIRLEP